MKKKAKVHAVKKIKKASKHGKYLCKTYIQIISMVAIVAIVLISTVKMTASVEVLGASTQIDQGSCSGHIFCK